MKKTLLLKEKKKTFYSFLSTSPEFRIAFLLAKKGIVFTLGGDIWGYDLTLFNYYDEKEILIEPERQFLIEEVISNNHNINIKLKLLETPLVLEKIFSGDNNIEELKKQLKNEKRKNSELNQTIKQLENKNKDLEKKIKILESEISQYKSIKGNNEIQNLSKDNQNNNILNAVLEKDKEIKELKLKLSRYPFQLEDGEKLMSVIFLSYDQKVHYSIICKNTDKFSYIEGKLYEEYPDYEELETYFTVNGKRISRHKSLDDNKIRGGDNILLNVVDFD